MKFKYGIFALGLALVACAPMKPSIQFLDDLAKQGVSKTDDRPLCEVDPIDYELNAHLLALEIVDQSDVSFGFNILTSFMKELGLSLKTKRGQFLMTMELVEPLKPNQPIVNVQSRAKLSGIDFKGSIDWGRLKAEAAYYYQTPLSTLTNKGVSHALRERLDPI